METITFYSYKGGVGRTLALANIASFLVRAGRNVCVMDMDLEAPGLHYKVLQSEPDRRRNLSGGVVDLLGYFLEHQQLPERLTEHVQVIEGRPQQRVPLFLLPAGNPRWAKYWQTLARVDWRTLIYEEPRAGIPLFLELKARLEAEYRLDYLLIDARTGVTEVGGLATAILPDTLVCFFANNDESFDGTQAVIQGSLERRSQQRVVPVLTRVSAAPDEILKRNALQHLNEGLDETLRQKALLDVCLLHTEPALELRERLLLDVEDAAAALPLTLDYLDLLRHLAPETALDEINRLAKTDIAKDASQKAVDAIIVEMAGGAPDLAAARRNALDERLAYFRAMGVSRLAGEPHGTEHLKIYLDLIRQRSTLDAERSRQRLDETVEVLRELSQRERKYERELQEQAAVRDHMRLQEEGRRLQTLSQSERHEEVLAALQALRVEMKGWPESRDEAKEILLGIGCESALWLGRWEDLLSLNRDFTESRVLRGATALDVARARFNDYVPLLRLQKHDEARLLLLQCLGVFESAGSSEHLGMVHSALASLEDELDHVPAAVQHITTALRYNYAAMRPMACAICHFNLANFLIRTNSDAAGERAHLLASALIWYQTNSESLPMSVRALRANRANALPGAIPANFDALCQLVEQTEGVRFRELFSRLPRRAASGDEALRTILDMITRTATLT